METIPYVTIRVYDGACIDGTEPVFERKWGGIRNKPLGWYDSNHGRYQSCGHTEINGAKIHFYNNHDPKMMATIDGKNICGTRNGSSFLEAIRPDSNSGNCPMGTTPCSQFTSPENTVCYPQDQHEELCPITEIRIVDRKTMENINQTAYTIQEYR